MDSMDRDTEIPPETAIDGIPDSWVDEGGVRHAVIYDESLPHYKRLVHVGNDWCLIEKVPF